MTCAEGETVGEAEIACVSCNRCRLRCADDTREGRELSDPELTKLDAECFLDSRRAFRDRRRLRASARCSLSANLLYRWRGGGLCL